MADKKTKTEESPRSIWGALGTIALVLIIFAVLIAIINPEDSGSEGEGVDAPEDVLTAEQQRQYYTLEKFVEEVKPMLSDEGREDLETVWDYVKDDPTVLSLENDEHPEEIRQAFENVREELDISFGSSDRPAPTVEVGEIYTVDGTLEEADEESPVGQVYTIVDTDTNATLYFVFSGDTLAMIEDKDMVGKHVELEVEIEKVEDGKVSYSVASGPKIIGG